MEVRPVDPNATWVERFIEFMALPLIWAYGLIQTFLPDFSAQEELPPLVKKYDIVQLPGEERAPSWDQEKFLSRFKDEDEWDHNLQVFIQAMECQLQTQQGYSCELVRFLREVKKKLPAFAEFLARTYIEMGHELDQKGDNPVDEDEKKVAEFFERSTLSTKNIYAAAVYLQMDEALKAFKAKEKKEQLQHLIDLIPITTRTDTWQQTCRTYTQVWHTLCELDSMQDLMIGLTITSFMKESNQKYSSGKSYLEKGGDLLTLREALVQLA